jgi:putative tryptophan/tyrosine transport system substrate-binding protein
MAIRIQRREFITTIGGAAAWPLVARAQQPVMPVIGFLSAREPEESAHLVEAYRRALKEGGFIEGQNVAIEFRWAHGDYSRLPALAADLVGRNVAVISAVGGDPTALAAKAATAAIPIIFNFGTDPVRGFEHAGGANEVRLGPGGEILRCWNDEPIGGNERAVGCAMCLRVQLSAN